MKLFKKASANAIKIGTAQLQYEDMVRRAERKLSERARMSLASSQTAEEKAEAIASELFHTPGTLLTRQEIALMWQESGCQDSRQQPNCYNINTVFSYRTPDGTCNNLENPLFGASGTSFTRLIPAQYEDGMSSLRGNMQSRFFDLIPTGAFTPPNPSPRFISTTIIVDKQQEELPFTHILMQWGQFLDHDLDLSPELEAECEGCVFTDICEPIRVLDTDKAFGLGTQNNGDCLPLRRSLPTCPTDPPGSFSPREQINDITSFIDGSMVYGSNKEVSDALREFVGGRLRVGPNFPGNKPSLPPIDKETAEFVACPNRDDCFFCGDARCNEQISLSIMQTIWLREHNRCAMEMARVNPQWNDERLYQECRRIMGALIQKITYSDYLPKVLGPANFDTFIGSYVDYDPDVDPGMPNAFATAAYRYGHSLIRPVFDRLDLNLNPLRIGPLNLANAFFNPPQFNKSLGTDPIVRGLLNRNALRMDEFLNSVLTTQLFQTPASPGFDLASLNIQRGRDHGLPPYLMWRNFCLRVFQIASPFENLMTKVNFLNTYGSLDTVDLWIGGLAEERLPESLLGATFACIFGITFANVRTGDSFYYERPGMFTPGQLQTIRDTTLSSVLCENLDNLQSVQPDAFLSNQTRVRCDQIPTINFNEFREDVCFFRVGVAPRSQQVVVNTFFRSVQTIRFLLTSLTFAPSPAPQFQCQAIECPAPGKDVDVYVYSNPATALTSNPKLPSSLYKGPIYRATWGRGVFDAGQGGVFTSEEACTGSTNVAMQFSYAGLAEAESDGATDDDRVPDELFRLLADEGKRVRDKQSEVVAVEVAAVSDDALMQELEGALKALQQQ